MLDGFFSQKTSFLDTRQAMMEAFMERPKKFTITENRVEQWETEYGVKPCPFCGKSVEVSKRGNGIKVFHDSPGCPAQGEHSGTAWERRFFIADPMAEINALRAALRDMTQYASDYLQCEEVAMGDMRKGYMNKFRDEVAIAQCLLG